MSSISWGRHQRFAFTSSGGLDSWAAPTIPAVFAVTYQRDPRNSPKSHTVLFFGESDNLAQHADAIKRQMHDVWSDEGGPNGSSNDLFIFVHAMDGSTRTERSRVVERLVLEYQPQGNKVAY